MNDEIGARHRVLTDVRKDKNMRYEIWLKDDYWLFDWGLAYLDDGRKVELKAMPHTSTYGPDSLLLDDAEHLHEGRFPLRWLIRPDGIDFYSVGEDTPDVYFHNFSGKPIRLGDLCVLPDGESVVKQFRNCQIVG